MDTGKRQHLQDIYATDESQRDDYTPQVSSEVVEERKRDMRRQKFSSFLLGMTVLGVLLALVFIVVQKFVDNRKEMAAPAPITEQYIPRYSLPAGEQWVLDLNRRQADPRWNGEGERPFSTVWVKKAAHNIILAEQAAELGRSDPAALNDAARYYEQALEILPELEGIRVPLGMVYFRLNKLDKALELLEETPDTDLTFDILNNLGYACIQAEAYERAEEYLKRSLELKPAYAEALKNLALLYKELERPEEAIKAYEAYLDERPLDSITRYDFALFLTKSSKWQVAAEQLRLLADEEPDDHVIYSLLARAESKLGNADASIKALRRAFQLADPKLAIAWMDDEEFEQLRTMPEFQELMKFVQKEEKSPTP